MAMSKANSEVTRREALKVGAITAAGTALAIAGIGAARPSEALAHSVLYTDADGSSYWYDDGCGLSDAEVSSGFANTGKWVPSFYLKGKAKGKKLKATDAQCKKIANLVVSEWGEDLATVAAGATLIANRFELYGKKYSNVYNYTRKCGWFGTSGDIGKLMGTNAASSKAVTLVKAVLTQGKRTLPAYVDDFCLLDDVRYAQTGKKRVTDKAALAKNSTYKPHKTVVCDTFGNKLTFYGRIGADIAGYTSAKNRKKYGEGRWALAD